MDQNKHHFHHKTNKATNADNTTKAERKREQKMREKEIENFNTCTTKTNKKTNTDQDGTTEEEEEEEETETSATSATITNNATENSIFKRFKTSEEEFDKFETTSTSHLGEGDAHSQVFDVPFAGTAMSTTTTSGADEFILIGERLAALYNGTLMSRETQNGRGGSKGLRFKCTNQHEFTISYCRLGKIPTNNLDLETCKDIWCVKCHNFYYRCKKKAEQNGAVVTSRIFEAGHVKLNCRMGHDFKISIHRNPDKVWCTHCKKDAKKELLKQKEIDLEKKKQQCNEQQRKLFEESRNNINSEQSSTSQNQITIQEILRQVELKAKYETQKFMTQEKTELSESNVFNVYKTIYMPSEILQASLQSLGENLNSCFRKMAVLLHPDKNSHPLSNRAFQKLSQVYMICQEMR